MKAEQIRRLWLLMAHTSRQAKKHEENESVSIVIAHAHIRACLVLIEEQRKKLEPLTFGQQPSIDQSIRSVDSAMDFFRFGKDD